MQDLMAVLASVFFFLSLDMDIKANNCLDIIYRKMTAFVLENAFPGEASLRAQGLGGGSVANLDAVGAFIQEAPTLRSGPREAPSTFLADRLEDQINFVAQGLKSRGEEDPSLLDRFNIFRQEIRNSSREGLSHRDWVYYNYLLARVSTPLEEGGGWDPPSIPFSFYLRKIKDEFPEHIMASVPGNLGVISFNRSFLTGVTPFSLQNDRRWVHGAYMWPLDYQNHDGGHFSRIKEALESLDTLELEALARFHRHFLLSTRALTGKERQKVEIIYFILWHHVPPNEVSSHIEDFAATLNKYPGELKMAKKSISKIINGEHIWNWIEGNPPNARVVYGNAADYMVDLIVESGE